MLKTVWGTDWRYLLAILAITSCYIGEVSCVICPHCNKDFKSLGRHIWRCKSKVEINTAQGITTQPSGSVTNEIEVPQRSLANNGGSVQPTNDPADIREENNEDNDEYVCYCGRVCAGLRGLQAHKRACKYLDLEDIKTLFENPVVQEETNIESDEELLPRELKDYHGKLPALNYHRLMKTGI